MTSAVSAASAQVTVSRRTKRCAGTRPSGLAGLSIRVSPSKTCAVNLAPGGDPCRAHPLPLERVAIRRPSARGRRHLLYPVRTYADGKGLEGELRRRLRGFPKDRPSPQSVQRWWYRQAQHAGLVGPGVTSGLNMHQARHTFAMELRRVAGIDAASDALGHADLSTTLGIYGHRDGSDLERAMESYVEWPERSVPPE